MLSHPPEDLRRPAARQWQVLARAGLQPVACEQAGPVLAQAALVVDALLGYSLRGAPRGPVADLIQACNAHARRALSLDLPSGLDATTGERPGAAVRADRLLTLALPKVGLLNWEGDLYLTDIGIPPVLYRELGAGGPALLRAGGLGAPCGQAVTGGSRMWHNGQAIIKQGGKHGNRLRPQSRWLQGRTPGPGTHLPGRRT